ncbi:alpha/beta fold hydrolase [Myxococcus sp. Y35]|uniref:alpha/beta fold hydrolase n=1 Tax=Pseudomyxococcus flavus TaxID=3115648 RepID=UPI003CF0CC3D
MSSSDSKLNLCQQAFLLSHESNYLGDNKDNGLPGVLGIELGLHLIGEVFPKLAGRGYPWSLAWGPAVYAPLGVPANVMYVATNADKSVYVVAIAGTNFNALLTDVIIEDNCVINAIPWANAFPSLNGCDAPSGAQTPHISQGTQIGVNNLLAMTDLAKRSLVDFLGSLRAKGSKTLIFAGHSLGGALAPTLALALATSKNKALNIADWGNVYVLPTAGPTPGDENFANLFNKVFPPVKLTNAPQAYYAWNQNIWNSLDAVPHAWEASMLGQIPSLYKQAPWMQKPPTQPMPPALAGLVTGASLLSLIFNINASSPFKQIQNIQVDGTFCDDDRIQGDGPDALFQSFLAQVGYQHIDAYSKFYQVTDLVTPAAKAGLHHRISGLAGAVQKMAQQSKRQAALQSLTETLGKIPLKAG